MKLPFSIALLLLLFCHFTFSQQVTSFLSFHPSTRRFNSSIVVQGTGKTSVAVTQADFYISVEAQKTTASEAQQEVGTSSARIMETLQQMEHVFKLRTSSITLYPVYEYHASTERTQRSGFRSSNSIEFSVSRWKVMNLVANDTEIEKARDRSLQLAVQDAMTNMNSVLSALYDSVSLEHVKNRLEVTSINIRRESLPIPVRYSGEEEDVHVNHLLLNSCRRRRHDCSFVCVITVAILMTT
ncbi:hypothetical protein C9374_005906 [Naegleria lovaniensis]|uniref:DUF541 domain-containing protein n=1 Tax=Naegleria lovaniensis TaxID=51637 RepID=A0AA88KHS6_NAELO|nr:uncharacterized protein C9374_005906 [Naegleria lovaniensis]KAG2382114.1 hypothetical protein C9374_005906 [Naegleria lovaniensis]